MRKTTHRTISIAFCFFSILLVASCNKVNDKLVSVEVYPIVHNPADSVSIANLLRDIDVRVEIMENDLSMDTFFVRSDNFNCLSVHPVRNLQDGIKVTTYCAINRTDPNDSLYFQLNLRAVMHYSDGTTGVEDQYLVLGYPYCATSSSQLEMLQKSTYIIRFVDNNLVVDE